MIRRQMSFVLIFSIFLSGAALQESAYAAAYNIDQSHSSITFKVRHLFTKVRGNFNQFEGTVEYDPKAPDTWQTEVSIQTNSIDTANQNRDEHLLSADFFDASTYPVITFKSTGVTDATETSAKLHGQLSLHGIEKPVILDIEIHGVGKDPWGNTKAGFSGTTTLNRKDFGIIWNEKLDTGQLLLGDDVEILLEVEANLVS